MRPAGMPATAGPMSAETRTVLPSREVGRHDRLSRHSRRAARPPSARSVAEAIPQAMDRGRSRSVIEKRGAATLALEDAIVGLALAFNETAGAAATGIAIGVNASGLTSARAGSTNEPASAPTHTQRLGRSTRCSPRSNASPAPTISRARVEQYSIQAAIMISSRANARRAGAATAAARRPTAPARSRAA